MTNYANAGLPEGRESEIRAAKVCAAEEWVRDGRGFWAVRTCSQPVHHRKRHVFGSWQYYAKQPNAIRADAAEALVDTLRQQVETLTEDKAKLTRILEIERNYLARIQPCPDCRDKVKAGECERCRRQRSEAQVETLRQERDEALARVDLWKAYGRTKRAEASRALHSTETARMQVEYTKSLESQLAALTEAQARVTAALQQICTDDYGPGGGRIVKGNSDFPGVTGTFYRGYNAGISGQFNKTREIALKALPAPPASAPPETKG